MNSEETAQTSHEVAVYECWCGNQVEIHGRNYTKVRWAANKFGFKNIGAFIGHNRECCDRPEYTSTVTREAFP